MRWIISRPNGTFKAFRWRDAMGHLTIDRSKAREYDSLNEATADAQDGDVVVPADGPVQRTHPLDVARLFSEDME